jgi:hypothetical protein
MRQIHRPDARVTSANPTQMLRNKDVTFGPLCTYRKEVIKLSPDMLKDKISQKDTLILFGYCIVSVVGN